MDSGASRTVMRFDTFLKISSSNKEEISGTGIGLTTANDEPLATKGTFLVKLDVERLNRITHPVIVVEKLAWPLLLGYDSVAIYGAKIDAREARSHGIGKALGDALRWCWQSKNTSPLTA